MLKWKKAAAICTNKIRPKEESNFVKEMGRCRGRWIGDRWINTIYIETDKNSISAHTRPGLAHSLPLLFSTRSDVVCSPRASIWDVGGKHNDPILPSTCRKIFFNYGPLIPLTPALSSIFFPCKQWVPGRASRGVRWPQGLGGSLWARPHSHHGASVGTRVGIRDGVRGVGRNRRLLRAIRGTQEYLSPFSGPVCL